MTRGIKGLVLAGGEGTRLRPITHTAAKQLVPVANKPILFFALEQLAAAGIVEVGIVVGSTEPEIREAVGNGEQFGLSVTYLRQAAPLGLAHAILIARDFLGDDDVVMYLGDNLLRDGITPFVQSFRALRDEASRPRLGETMEPPAAQILLAQVPDPERFGVAELDEAGNVIGLVEKPSDPRSDLALVGVYLFDPTIHEAVRAIQPSDRGELEITDAIQWLIDNGHRVRHELLGGWWKDTGALDPLLEGNRLMLEVVEPRQAGKVDDESRIDGRVRIEEGVIVERSVIRGPVAIGAGTSVIDSYIGPYTAIGPRCQIVRSEVEHSIVMAGSEVIGIPRLVDSLVGRDVSVRGEARRPRAARLMVGDHSRIELEV